MQEQPEPSIIEQFIEKEESAAHDREKVSPQRTLRTQYTTATGHNLFFNQAFEDFAKVVAMDDLYSPVKNTRA
ncbi:MAG: hypothetical protein V2I33_26065 [Kangiellaceae bacterium]|jgi:hypothetical protein|nr:hypothetical protein [Kangiellaceae bacterium]